MRIHLRPLLLLVVLCAGSFLRAQQPAIIPKPVSTTWLNGHFMIDKNTVLVAEPSEASSTGFFNSYLEQVYGVHLRVVAPDRQPAGDYILLSTAVDGENITNGGASNPIGASAEEGSNSLKVNSVSYVIIGATHSGTFYGIQTLIQLLPVSPYLALAS